MEKIVSVVIVSCLFIMPGIFASVEAQAGALTNNLLASSQKSFRESFSSMKTYEEYEKLTSKYQKMCGICYKMQPESTENWGHPFGDFAHTDCLKLLKNGERYIQQYSFKEATHDFYECFHRLAVWYLMKLCLPHSIAKYRERFGKDMLDACFTHSVLLAAAHYIDFFQKINQEKNTRLLQELQKDDMKSCFCLFLGSKELQKSLAPQ